MSLPQKGSGTTQTGNEPKRTTEVQKSNLAKCLTTPAAVICCCCSQGNSPGLTQLVEESNLQGQFLFFHNAPFPQLARSSAILSTPAWRKPQKPPDKWKVPSTVLSHFSRHQPAQAKAVQYKTATRKAPKSTSSVPLLSHTPRCSSATDVVTEDRLSRVSFQEISKQEE